MSNPDDSPLDGKSAWEREFQKTPPTSEPAGSPPDPADDGEPAYRLPNIPESWKPADGPSPLGGDSTESFADASSRPAKSRSRSAPTITPTPTMGYESRDGTPRKKPRAGNFWSAPLALNLIVFVASVCVMTLELTATRLVGKHVGNTIYTWTSVIGVVLAGITAGNALGGWLADRYDRARTLAWMFLLSSISAASVLWLDQLVPRFDKPASWSLPTWVLSVVAAIFLAPSLALGTTSPLIASLALQRSRSTGRTLGNVYAWGAFGSIVGTFLTGFYLIDVLGTRSIIALVAGTLAVLALLVSTGRTVFRTALVLGWLQLLGGITACSLATQGNSAAAGEWLAARSSWGLSEPERDVRIGHWQTFAGDLGTKLHELGLLVCLRDDRLGEYHDESSYSYINVGQQIHDGDPVKFLRLDHLVHSYYNPEKPLKLHYDYERIYAAVTLQVTANATTDWEGPLPDFPGREALLAKLPAGVTFDAEKGTLKIAGGEPFTKADLQGLSPDFRYWNGLRELARETNVPDWGGYTAIGIGPLPAGVKLPVNEAIRIRYDELLESLTAYDALSEPQLKQLSQLCHTAPWFDTLENWWQAQRKAKTLSLGGGGYIFPRWLAAEFPGSDAIDVVELDPAVYRAVQTELGLRDVGPERTVEHSRIHTYLGDARNVVRDFRKQSPRRQYDCIYGDAFNDFSIPWHLTTVEFHRELKELLSPTGVYLANVIDAYPRTVFPDKTQGTAESAIAKALPIGVSPGDLEKGTWVPAVSSYAPLEIRRSPPSGFRFRVKATLSDSVLQKLIRLDPKNDQWVAAMNQLYRESQRQQPFAGTLPAAILPKTFVTGEWAASPAPFAGVEVQVLSERQHAVAFRGAISESFRQKLLELDPQNGPWRDCVTRCTEQSREKKSGRFLARYVTSLAEVFPDVYVFSGVESIPGSDRDTFIVVAALKPLDLTHLSQTGYWKGLPFASLEQTGDQRKLGGQMESLLELAGGKSLSDDFAPVDNLLLPVFAKED